MKNAYMEEQSPRLVDTAGILIAALTMAFTSYYFISTTAEIGGSLFAALITTSLTWVSYTILKWLFLALRR